MGAARPPACRVETFQKPSASDSGSRRHNQLKAKLLRFLGKRSDLLFAASGFVEFDSFVNVLLP
ncbi:MAG: hypothetical protein ABSG41_23225, partial [Bryobacteraceae bacterium]